MAAGDSRSGGRGRGGDRETLVRICDLAGRPRGAAFAADDHGTLITSHEAVDGLARLVLHGPDGRTGVVGADAVIPLPEVDLALVRAEGLGARPLPVAARAGLETGSYVRIAALGWRQARVLGTDTSVTYTATDRFHVVPAAVELAIGTDGSDALGLGGGAAGGPVLDAATGAVLAVLGTALQAGHRAAAGFAVPLREAAAADPGGPLDQLLRRNAATVPAYGQDLNLAAALTLTATSVGSDGPRDAGDEPGAASWGQGQTAVERPEVAEEFTRFLTSPASPAPSASSAAPASVLALVGDPGTGRSTELAALAARRARGPEPAPTVWLRGAGLRSDDASIADAVARTLQDAGRIVAASEEYAAEKYAAEKCAAEEYAASDEYGDGLGDIGPDRVARLVRDAGRPLLLLLDCPEEMPPVLAHRLTEWTEGTATWLRDTGARLVVACRPAYWEQAGALFPADALYSGEGGPERLPACVRLTDLPEPQAARARQRYGIPDDAVAPEVAGHPLALRLLSDVRAALPERPDGCPGREEIFTAYLDLVCLRVAVRLAAPLRLRGTAVRRLAAKVSGQLHEAARCCLGPGQGELDRESFEALFPWPTGWASAVLTEGVLVPAGTGYRFAHEELADWFQGTHLDLDAALYALVHRQRADTAPPQTPVRLPSLPVPRHRIGPVVQALLLLDRRGDRAALARRLEELTHAADHFAGRTDDPARPADDPARPADAEWWARRLLSEVLARVPDARPYRAVLRLLVERTVAGNLTGAFGGWFWRGLPLPEPDRLDLLRHLVVADPVADPAAGGERFLDAVGAWLRDDPEGVQPLLTRWFTDERPLPAAPDATVATAAQALLHTHRHRAIDALTEALVACAHPRGDELLAVLADEEPSAICRAVDRWAHDERPARRVAAAAYALRAAPRVSTDADRRLLRYAALALLARPADCTLHGAALALLVRDPHTRNHHLPLALKRFAAGDPRLAASALAAALTTHPEPVIAAFRTRLREPGPASGDILRTLADVTTPALARQVAVLVRDFLELRPEAAAYAAGYVDRRLEHGPAARAVLFPLVAGVLRSCPAQVRRELAPVLAAPGTRASRALRRELLDVLLAGEDDPAVLDEVLTTAATGAARRGPAATRALVHRTGRLLVRTPDGAARFDRHLVELARADPGFATLLDRWLADTPQDWAAVVGPSARRMIENLAVGPHAAPADANRERLAWHS
ncbi:serine protease [Streptomyces apocyni]|uniref:serine protease n=1 Tax=Streptomyces apocyni TaxID=2654677 RepID=UPI0012EA5111|nr:serine protease [Streptomyces apocyni]